MIWTEFSLLLLLALSFPSSLFPLLHPHPTASLFSRVFVETFTFKIFSYFYLLFLSLPFFLWFWVTHYLEMSLNTLLLRCLFRLVDRGLKGENMSYHTLGPGFRRDSLCVVQPRVLANLKLRRFSLKTLDQESYLQGLVYSGKSPDIRSYGPYKQSGRGRHKIMRNFLLRYWSSHLWIPLFFCSRQFS